MLSPTLLRSRSARCNPRRDPATLPLRFTGLLQPADSRTCRLLGPVSRRPNGEPTAAAERRRCTQARHDAPAANHASRDDASTGMTTARLGPPPHPDRSATRSRRADRSHRSTSDRGAPPPFASSRQFQALLTLFSKSFSSFLAYLFAIWSRPDLAFDGIYRLGAFPNNPTADSRGLVVRTTGFTFSRLSVGLGPGPPRGRFLTTINAGGRFSTSGCSRSAIGNPYSWFTDSAFTPSIVISPRSSSARAGDIRCRVALTYIIRQLPTPHSSPRAMLDSLEVPWRWRRVSLVRREGGGSGIASGPKSHARCGAVTSKRHHCTAIASNLACRHSPSKKLAAGHLRDS
ncbi:hypothetical protein FNV43_RR20972 [Rhamnella rubrinervis]|uniref:Uncharacterized protein n=1 Tax=Rhamnella rubrinervis TaxID=2594499 RepID=A0A8K0DVC9_9ROSA|nr:hypothetical protein FNV43_RR20972 [Rhamnella rubrinervis]